jgi:hypothetical protein
MESVAINENEKAAMDVEVVKKIVILKQGGEENGKFSSV